MTVHRSARVLACLPLSMWIRSSPRVIWPLVLCVRCAAMNLFSQKELANSKRVKSSYQSPLSCGSLLKLFFFRYSNVGYIVVQSMCHNLEPKKITSYDIMCQWSTHVCKHLQEFPLDGAESLDDKIIAQMVPKFHLTAHCQECCANFLLNYEPGAGRGDMEGPEWMWFGLQGGGSTKDQGPGFWSDAMDNKFGHWNWTKLTWIGM